MNTFSRRFALAIASFAVVIGVVAAPAMAASSKQGAADEKIAQGAANFVQNLGDRAIDLLKNEEISEDEMRARFRELLNDSFDMETIGRFVLGRYWKQASAEQQERYQILFRKMVEKVYLSRFEDYTGQVFKVSGPRADGAGRDIIVQSKLIPPQADASHVAIDWRVRYKDNRYQIVDVVVEGVSMSMTKRQDFSAVIQRGGGRIDALLSELDNKYGDSETRKG